jgi:hypothetical protein
VKLAACLFDLFQGEIDVPTNVYFMYNPLSMIVNDEKSVPEAVLNRRGFFSRPLDNHVKEK